MLVHSLEDITASLNQLSFLKSNPNNPAIFVQLHVIVKKVFGLNRFFKQPSPRCNLVLIFALVLIACMYSTGCGKPKPPATQTTTDQKISLATANQTSEQLASTTPPTVTNQPNGEPDLKELNRSLLRWILGNRRRPKSFEDFAATAGIMIPPPPAGKKYVIAKDMHIQLVDR